MKKLMIAAAIVCAAVVSQAATIKWSMDSSFEPGTTTPAENYAVYFFNNADFARNSAIAALDMAYTDWNTGFLSNALGTKKLTDEDGYANASNLGNYAASSEQTGYLVIFNAEDAADATLAYVTDAVTITMPGAGTAGNLKFGDQTGTQNADNWYGAVPEPTSGLLLLIGVAGLALRRRRA